MAWVCVDKNGDEYIYADRPSRIGCCWNDCVYINYVQFSTDIKLPKGSIKKLIGRDLTWKDEPVKIE